MWRTQWCAQSLSRLYCRTHRCFHGQVDKLINPFTLLVGPCLVSYLMYKSTLPISKGGYHLPWWYVCIKFFTVRLLTKPVRQEYPSVLPRVAFRNSDSEAPPPPMEPSARHHLRTRIHSLWVLLRHYETICPVYITRGKSLTFVYSYSN